MGCGDRTVTLDPAACNALTSGPAGLLVPGTEVEGLAPGGAVSTERSVDIDVTHVEGCPDTWTVGARLTPVFGEVAPTAALDLLPMALLEWADVPGFQFTAPEAGVYHIAADVLGSTKALSQEQYNRAPLARLTLNGTFVPGTQRVLGQAIWAQPAGQPQGGGTNSTGTINKILPLAAGDVVQVQGAYQGDEPSTPASLEVGNPADSLLSWHKVAD